MKTVLRVGRRRAHRERLSWTQEQLAAAADVSLRTVQRAEEGQIIAAESLQALAGALDVTQELLRTDLDAAALEAAVKLSHRYVTDRKLPDKAIDLMDEATWPKV